MYGWPYISLADYGDAMSHPDETWSLPQLARYVQTGLEKVGRLESEVRRLGCRTAVEVHRIGHALFLAHEQTKPRRQWTKWLAKNRIPRMTAWEAVKLYRSASEEDVAMLTISEAKVKFGIYPEFAPQDESDAQAKAPRQFSGEVAERQLNVLYRRLKGAAEVVTAVNWEQDLLYSPDVDEILQFCKQVVRTINQQRKTVPQPKPEDTRQYLAELRSL